MQRVSLKLFGELGDYLQKGQHQPKSEPIVLTQAAATATGDIVAVGTSSAATASVASNLSHIRLHIFNVDGTVGYPGPDGTLRNGS